MNAHLRYEYSIIYRNILHANSISIFQHFMIYRYLDRGEAKRVSQSEAYLEEGGGGVKDSPRISESQ